MIKFIWIPIALQWLAMTECNHHKILAANDSIPICITKKLDSIKRQPVWNPPAEVNEYFYNDKQVFLFSSNCCDQYDLLYDNQCNLVCAPSGGITGRGDGKCLDFFTIAKHIKLVWKDPR